MWQATLLAYVALAVVQGVKARATTLDKFVLGDTLRGRAMVATVVSTFYGASSILGGVSLTYQIGLGVLWFMLPFYLGSLAAVLLLGQVARSDTRTLPDFLGGFYGESFAVAASLLLASLCLIPEEIIAGGKILSSLTPISTPAGMGITAFVVVVPVVIGGMKADVATDTAQFILMMLMLVLLLPIVLSPHQWSIPSGHVSPFSALTVQEMGVFFVSLFFLPITSAPLYQRFFASESAACARRSLLISIGIWIAIDAVVVVCGFSALAMFPDLADPDLSLIVLGTKLPVAARPVFLVGALAAILSTVNSFLQSGASSLGYDVLKHLRPSMQDRQILIVSRFLVVVLGLASLSIAVWFQEIVPALMFTLSMWTAGILVPTLAALAGVRLKKPAALCSLVGGVLSYVGWEIWRPCAIDPLFVGLAASLLLSLTVRLMDNRSR